MAGKDDHWMEKVNAESKAKGTAGSFGKATGKKIAAGIKKGGVEEKRAVLARTFKKEAQKKDRKKG